MLPQTVMALVIAGNAVVSGMTSFTPDRAHRSHGGDAPAPDARYEATAREVTNWRSEAADALTPKPVILLAALFGVERPVVTRCVKLNNYWCIKSARWNGEIGTDGEGHVGFASADDSADAAALLLRRYYLDFNRKSALDIVRRWAPAECNLFTGFSSIGGGFALAVKGIGGTVRAKYLASHRVRLTAEPAKGAKRGAPSPRVSVIIPRALPKFRVPDIAVGMGEKAKPEAPARASAAAPKAAPAKPVASAKPAPAAKPAAPVRTASASSSSCAPDETRLQNYAARMVETLGLGPNDDLKLFQVDGTPLPNLAPVMLAMSGFELGLLRPDPALIEEAVRRAAARAAEARPLPAKVETR